MKYLSLRAFYVHFPIILSNYEDEFKHYLGKSRIDLDDDHTTFLCSLTSPYPKYGFNSYLSTEMVAIVILYKNANFAQSQALLIDVLFNRSLSSVS